MIEQTPFKTTETLTPMPYYQDNICVKHVEMGRGVFATDDIAERENFEFSPMISIPEEDCEHLDNTLLTTYRYEAVLSFGDQEISTFGLIGLGNSSLYNHSFSPNADYEIVMSDQGEAAIRLFAIKNIEYGEEITINYNGEANDQTALDPAYGIPGGVTHTHYAGGWFNCDYFDEERITLDISAVDCTDCQEAATIMMENYDESDLLLRLDVMKKEETEDAALCGSV
tara:strand:+ start:100467 stop:101147 length:681 start_codon:yes stop_codon:yes gene_type:complete